MTARKHAVVGGNGVDACILDHALLIDTWCGDVGTRQVRTSTIPNAMHVMARDDLYQPAGLNVPDLDETRVEEENVR